MTHPLTVVKACGPKLVPFFKTCAIFFVLYGTGSKLESIFYCIFKCLPIISLIVFVLLHGMDLSSDHYAYSRKITIGLIFSMLGDAFLVWKNVGYFIHGLIMFAIAQGCYASAFGLTPHFNLPVGIGCYIVGLFLYWLCLPSLNGILVYLALVYCLLIMTMLWRATARLGPLKAFWPWTRISSCLGAAAFVFSDAVISLDKFVAPIPYSQPLIMISYYIAQLGIAMSVVDSHVDSLLRPDQLLKKRD